MAIGLNADTEGAYRASIPSGGAGTLSDGAFTNFFVGVWLYRPSSGNNINLTSSGYIIHLKASAREMKLGYDNTFGGGTAADPLLQVFFNSGGGVGASQTFASANFLDEWVYYFLCDNSVDGQIAGYIRLSDPNNPVTIVRTNDNAGSQFINNVTFGNESAFATGVMGNYAYARAVYGTGLDETSAVAYAASATADAGDWAFWPLADNADTGDDSGNARDLTFTAGLSSETSPVLTSFVPSMMMMGVG